ncbi:hypothetical protein HAX54_017247, partial [Datura stramonium]|nr:hypothetical protein [Datura stramonium]
VSTDIWRLGRVIYPRLIQLPTGWPNMLEFLETYKPKLFYLPVTWHPPDRGS